ncbi:LacI family DNA-binding transcriptional regulator [Bifidobacterium sp. ESL0775]|uniref:LacI family DNA-binding transcriptional regulator n=1 Tax=Bifidobacterium sp. ESL0775 TaxID=2983230 RepID=UPI0023F68EC6|nr:LacI family DNA-binding transcriptional regulator [Bifidobacterium sp. ESL0775]WEV69071.1 LacI family DNA-binding transcriptional regulator [Bifidobacterium sp. ESL0775]
MATITDVAHRANVSKNTVSRYLNNRGYISKETRGKIQDAIDSLHYQPNQIARSLYNNKTNIVGLVIPDVIQPFFATMTSKIEDQLAAHDYRMILCNTMHSSEKEKKCISMLTANKVDGIIIGSHSIDINYKNIEAPIVALDRDLADTIPVVNANHTQGGILASEAVIGHGCKNVAQIIGNTKVRSPSIQRHRVFAEQMRAHGIKCSTFELKLNQFEFSTYLGMADHFFASNPGIDGIFASDLVILAFQRTALEHGVKVPDDLFMCGYDGSFVYQTGYPPFPTIIQPFDQLAKTLVDVLIKRMNHDSDVRLTYTLPVRMSDGHETDNFDPDLEPTLMPLFPDCGTAN